MDFKFESTAEEVTEGLDLTGKTYLVTGSNSGLGYESIRVLAMRGANIIATARTQEKAQHALNELNIQGTAVACELSDLSSVRQAVSQIKASGFKLDAIIANAGIMALPELQQKDGLELQFYTNHIGHFLLVTELVDQLTDQGRVVMLSSGAHYYAQDSGLELDNLSGEHDYNDWRMYGRSKMANIQFANALNKRFEGSNRRANSVHPGVIVTNLARHVPNKDQMYAQLKNRIKLKTLGQGAATQVLVATHPALQDVGGKYFSDCQISSTAPIAQDSGEAEALWAFSVDFVSTH